MIANLPKYLVNILILFLLQVLLLNHMSITTLEITPYLFLVFLLMLDFEIPRWMVLLIGFGGGMVMDIFSDTYGLHMVSCTFAAYMRSSILKIDAPREGYEKGTAPSVDCFGWQWFVKYSSLMVISHHLLFFCFESFTFKNFHITIVKVVLTSIYTLAVILLHQLLILKRK